MFVGIADTFTASFASEAEVSGVSLVSSFNTVLIFLFTVLSSGGAVIGIDTFGVSGKGPDVMAHFGFTPENVVARALQLIP